LHNRNLYPDQLSELKLRRMVDHTLRVWAEKSHRDLCVLTLGDPGAEIVIMPSMTKPGKLKAVLTRGRIPRAAYDLTTDDQFEGKTWKTTAAACNDIKKAVYTSLFGPWPIPEKPFENGVIYSVPPSTPAHRFAREPINL